MIYIADAHFVKTAVDLEGLPSEPGVKELAFIGRSNVGKSSLINALTRRKGLARVSNTPGRTQAINIFNITLVNKEAKEQKLLRMIDLPGLGYAHASKSDLAFYHQLVSQYTSKREQLSLALQLFDIRRDVGEEDKQISQYLTTRAQTYALVVTKADKIVKAQRVNRVKAICQGFGLAREHALLTSVDAHLGLEEVLAYIWQHT